MEEIWLMGGFSHEPMTTMAFFRLFENDAVLGEGAQIGNPQMELRPRNLNPT